MVQVFLWCSHPEAGNDDLETVFDYLTLEAAEAFIAKPNLRDFYKRSIQYFELVGPGVERIVKNPEYVGRPADTGEWHREHAHQMGMMDGCAAYNDAIGV